MWTFPPVSSLTISRVELRKARRKRVVAASAYHRAADLAAPKIRKRFLSAVDELGDYDTEELVETLNRTDIPGALRIVGIDTLPTLLVLMGNELTALTFRAVTIAVEELAGRKVTLNPTRANPRAVLWAQGYTETLVKDLGDQSREALRATITTGFTQDLPPREIARELRNVIGLTPRQAASTQKYRERLQEEGVSGIERKVERYADRQIRNRAEMIARTESIHAVSEAQRLTYEAAYEDGLLPRETGRQWLTAGEGVCPECDPMHEQRVGIDEQFVTGSGKFVNSPPVHVGCRCVVHLAV